MDQQSFVLWRPGHRTDLARVLHQTRDQPISEMVGAHHGRHLIGNSRLFEQTLRTFGTPIRAVN